MRAVSRSICCCSVVVVGASICSVHVSEAIGPVQCKFPSSGALLHNITEGIVRVHPNARDNFRGSLMYDTGYCLEYPLGIFKVY